MVEAGDWRPTYARRYRNLIELGNSGRLWPADPAPTSAPVVAEDPLATVGAAVAAAGAALVYAAAGLAGMSRRVAA
jgi:hypothetical protein